MWENGSMDGKTRKRQETWTSVQHCPPCSSLAVTFVVYSRTRNKIFMPSDLVARYVLFFWVLTVGASLAQQQSQPIIVVRCVCVCFWEDSCSHAGRRIKHTKKTKIGIDVCSVSKAKQRGKKVCVFVQWCKYHLIPSDPTIFGVCCGIMPGAWRKLSAWSIHNNKTKSIEILLSFARLQFEENIKHTQKKKEKKQPASRSCSQLLEG